MNVHALVRGVDEQLTAAAALGDDRTKEIATALATASTSAVRLALVQAVTDAAAEITGALLDLPGSPAVGVHLDGDEIALDVRVTAPAEERDAARREDGDATARITLRLSDALKTDIDAAAERDGVSVNTWLVRAAANAVRGPVPPFSPFPPGPRGRRGDQRITGWVNG